MTPPSAEYHRALELSAAQHRESKTNSGKLLRPHRYRIKEALDLWGCKTVLDYGCGRGRQYEWRMETGQTLEEFWGVLVVKYDPCYLPFAQEPSGTFDAVICTHVLPLIPIADLPWAVDRIYGFAGKGAYIAIDVGFTPRQAKTRWRAQNLPDSWTTADWIDLLSRHRRGIEVHFAVRESGKPGEVERYIISDAGLRGPL